MIFAGSGSGYADILAMVSVFCRAVDGCATFTVYIGLTIT
jgi:hypothetical protein